MSTEAEWKAAVLRATNRYAVAEAEVERLQARERELEAALRDLVRMDEAQVFVKEPWDRVFAEAKTLLAAVSAETEDDDG